MLAPLSTLLLAIARCLQFLLPFPLLPLDSQFKLTSQLALLATHDGSQLQPLLQELFVRHVGERLVPSIS